MLNFEFNNTKSLVVERGGASRLGQRIAQMGYQSVLLVTDPGLMATGMLGVPLQNLSDHQIKVTVFSKVEADPPESVILEATQTALDANVDCVIGFGGGSSMDVAKLVALIAKSKETLASVYGVNNAKGPCLPLVMVPTTAGTGSEVTPISIVTTGVGEKKGVVSPHLLPQLALLDAELTLGLPKHVTAATGIDAMVHAIEAYTSKRLKNPISDCLAKEALRLLSGSIHVVCSSGNDIDAREKMLLGACLAGMAFANSPVAAVHALAYPVGARFHVPHGLSNALVLPHVMRFNMNEAQTLYSELADVIVPGKGSTTAEKVESFVTYLEGLSREFGLPTKLAEVGIQLSDVQQLAEDAMKQTRLLINNPREVTYEDALQIYQAAL
jgi:alcohol dehydrogenase class IV